MNLIDSDKLIEWLNGEIRKIRQIEKDVIGEDMRKYTAYEKMESKEFALKYVVASIKEMFLETPTDNKTKLTDEQIVANRKHNQKYLKLDDTEIFLHEKLMTTKMNMFPQSLLDYLEKEHEGDVCCGDALSCWIADWIRSLRKSPDVPDKRCGTCMNFPEAINNNIGCKIGWKFQNNIKSFGITGNAVCNTDGAHCPDWTVKEQEKPKEKVRVWECVNCKFDIYFDDKVGFYKHYFHTCRSQARL